MLRKVYTEAGISPDQLGYLEAHGTGTKAGDPEELNAISKILCQNRSSDHPLLIGSVKSNMGHSEASSGLAALVKVLMTLNHGVIPPNLHFNTPNPDIIGLQDGTLKVVVEPTQFNGGYVGLSSFGFGGSNVHVILKPYHSSAEALPSEIPKLLVCSGRTKEAVEANLQYLSANVKESPVSILANHVAHSPLQSMSFRGYNLLSVEGEGTTEVKKLSGSSSRPVWYVQP